MIALDHASGNDASESWDDDFEFQFNASSPTRGHPPVISSTVPHEQESWDDAYEDEGTGDGPARVAAGHESDADTVSWGSDSDWSGDGDAEDVSHESYTHASSEPPEPRSPPGPITSTFDSTPQSPSSPSFFSRISPVKKWKARDRGDTVARGKEESHTKSTPLKSTPRWTRKRSSTTPAEVTDSSRHATLRNIAPPTTPLTPDLTFSLSSPSSPIYTPSPTIASRLAPVSKSHASQSSMLAPAPTTIPFATSSTHNLPAATDTPSSFTSPRRSSLGDLKRPGQLKIPERISRAQRDIKRDMGDVKDFAACIEQLRNLQHIYTIMLRDLRARLSPPPSSASLSPKKPRRVTVGGSPTASPTKYRPPTRKFSFAAIPSTEPEPLLRLDAVYGVWWECAELLIVLGGRADAEEGAEFGKRGRRPRAVTLGSGSDVAPQSVSPSRTQWRATTGRAGPRDFTPRQLALLRGMLHAEAGTGWDPRGAVSVPSGATLDGSVRGKARTGGLGIRELWRGLRKASGAPSSSGESSASEGPCGHASSPSISPSKGTVAAVDKPSVVSHRKQPTRRPSLAGIFGLGQRTVSGRVERAESGEDNTPTATIRGTVKRPAPSPFESSSPASPSSAHDRESSRSPKKKTVPPRLRGITDSGPSRTLASPKRPRLFSPSPARTPALTPNLALTPENIRPLLGHAQDVSVRLNECLGEVRALMDGTAFP